MERNLTTGSIPKTIFSFSLPYFLSYFLQTAPQICSSSDSLTL